MADIRIEKKTGMSWLMWVVLAVLLLALLIWIF